MRQYRIGELHQFLADFDVASALSYLSTLSVELWKNRRPVYKEGEAFTEWQCAFLAQELMRVGALQDGAPFQVGGADVRAMHLANGLEDYFQINDSGDEQEATSLRLAFLIRSANEQFIFQVDRSNLLARHLSLYDVLPRELATIDLPGEFLQRYALTIRDFMAIGFVVFTLLVELKKPIFSLDVFLEGTTGRLKDVVTKEAMQRFAGATSRAIESFRTRLEELGVPPPGLEKDWLNVLWRCPLVNLGDSYTVPSVGMLLQRFTAGLYFDFLDVREGDGKRVNELTSDIGRIFERHVGAELGEHFNQDELFAETEYYVGKQKWDGPDWTLIEGTKATLFECKSLRTTKAIAEYGNPETVVAKLKSVTDAIARFQTKAEHIKDKLGPMAAWPTVDDFEFVIVTLDPWWPELLVKQLINNKLAGSPGANVRYHLIWVEQLERLGAYRKTGTIFDLLRRRWSADANSDTRKYLFDEALRLKLTSTNSPRLDRLHDEFFGDLLPAEYREGRVGGQPVARTSAQTAN